MNKSGFFPAVLWSIITLAAAISVGNAQSAVRKDTVWGSVSSDGREAEPVSGALVVWKGASKGVYADKLGRFALPRQRAAADSIVVRAIGYSSRTIFVSDSLTTVTVYLAPENQTELRVEADAGPTITKAAIKTETIGKRDLAKAACCSLAESFEKNPSVEVSFADAATGAKQIQLLGLRGMYTQFLIEAVPTVRSMELPFGLDHIPGPFMESISISKGASSVTTGYESITGQINICMHNPRTAPSLYVNAYANTNERYELNLYGAQTLSDDLSTMTMAHVRKMDMGMDNNHDGFSDIPTFRQLNLVHRWWYNDDEIEWQVFVRGFLDRYESGQGVVHSSLGHSPEGMPPMYDITTDIQRLESFAKVGLLNPFEALESGNGVSLVVAGSTHDQSSTFGSRATTGRQTTLQVRGVALLPFSKELKLTTGFSFLYDDVRETLSQTSNGSWTYPFERHERVPGLYAEATFEPSKDLTVLMGLRNDWHNQFGSRLIPRIHVKWNAADVVVLRASAGRGWRVPTVIAENLSSFINSRTVKFDSVFRPEDAWNTGLSATTAITVFDRPLTLDAEVYHTTFSNQLIIDYDRSVRELWVTNLQGTSYATNAMLQAMFSPSERLELLVAYRWVDVQAPYGNSQQQRPMMSRTRALGTLSYATEGSLWQADLTISWNSGGRLPTTAGNPFADQRPIEFPDYWRMNAQITRRLGELELYAGIENATNFIQNDPIIAADRPFGQYFDASLTWGPLDPRMVYAGVRYTLQ